MNSSNSAIMLLVRALIESSLSFAPIEMAREGEQNGEAIRDSLCLWLAFFSHPPFLSSNLTINVDAAVVLPMPLSVIGRSFAPLFRRSLWT